MNIEQSGESKPSPYAPSEVQLSALSEEQRSQRERAMFLHPSAGLVFDDDIVDIANRSPDTPTSEEI